MLFLSSIYAAVFVLTIVSTYPARARAADNQNISLVKVVATPALIASDYGIGDRAFRGSHFSSHSASVVDDPSHRLQVPRIDTAPHTAKVIHFKRFSVTVFPRNWPYEKFVCDAMRIENGVSDTESSVPFKAISHPEPAAGIWLWAYKFHKAFEYAGFRHLISFQDHCLGLLRNWNSTAARFHFSAEVTA